MHQSKTPGARGDCAPGSYGGGKLETGKGRGLIAGHVIGLRRIGAAVKLSNKGTFVQWSGTSRYFKGLRFA
jgi:hypothetical protein